MLTCKKKKQVDMKPASQPEHSDWLRRIAQNRVLEVFWGDAHVSL